jgi:hypothetical protein
MHVLKSQIHRLMRQSLKKIIGAPKIVTTGRVLYVGPELTMHGLKSQIRLLVRQSLLLNRRSNEAVRICLDEESAVLKTVLRVLYLGKASSRADSNPAAGQLMALLGKTEPACRGSVTFWCCGCGSADPYTSDLQGSD